MTDYCTNFPSLAEAIVGNTLPAIQTYANNAFQSANQAAEALYDFEVTYVPVSVQFNVQSQTNAFTPPAEPTRTIGEVELPDDVPEVETERVAVVFNEPAPPAPPDGDYVYSKPGGEPDAFNVPAPGDAPTLDPITMPIEPDIQARLDAIEDPEFYAITIPTPPVLVLDTLEFEGERPEVDFAVPAQTFGFTETPYNSQLLDSMTARLLAIGEGGTGLPAHVWQAIYDQSRSQIDANAGKVLQEVMEETGNRGFSEPYGVTTRRALEVRQGNQNANNQLSRQAFIDRHQQELEQLRFFVTQGTALESVLISKHLAQEQRRFEVARYLFDSALATFNANVALHNAKVSVYQADAQVYRDRIEAERAKAEVYRAEVEAQKVIGEVNETLQRRFTEQVRSVLAMVEIYGKRIDAVRLQVETNGQRIEAHRTIVQTFAERVRAYEVEWNGYRARVEAELGSVQAADIASRNYATRVSAWGTKANVAFKRAETELGMQEFNVRTFEAQLRRWLGIVEARRTKVAADATALGAEASVFAAAGQIAQAASSAADRSHELEIMRGRTEAELYLKNGEINLQAALQKAGLTLESLKGAASVLGQIASSVWAALNVSAGISDTTSQSSSCDTNYNLSGEIAT
jgi:hypothetical protein